MAVGAFPGDGESGANQRRQKTLCARVKVLKKVSAHPTTQPPTQPTHSEREEESGKMEMVFPGALCTYLMRFFSTRLDKFKFRASFSGRRHLLCGRPNACWSTRSSGLRNSGLQLKERAKERGLIFQPNTRPSTFWGLTMFGRPLSICYFHIDLTRRGPPSVPALCALL